MEDAVLILALTALFVFGYFVAGRLDRFADEISRNAKRREAAAGRTEVILGCEKSPPEIEAEIEHFRKAYGQSAVVVLVSEDSELYEQLVCPAESDESGCRQE